MQTLIANTGLQFFRKRLSIDFQNVREKLYFIEEFNMSTYTLTLDLVHYFANDGVYVRKRDLWLNGFMPKGVVETTWEKIRQQTSDIMSLPEDNVFSVSVNTLMKNQEALLKKFENVWLPCPYFEYNHANKLEVHPYNWSRMQIVPAGEDENGKALWDLVFAFDTKTVYDNGNYSDDYQETPVFSSMVDDPKRFGFCGNELDLMNFCAADNQKSNWIDSYLMKLVHNTHDINNIKDSKRHAYLAAYIYLMHIIQKNGALDDVRLFRDQNVDEIKHVDLVVDMGNSKTTALLVEGSDFTKTRMLQLNNFTNPTQVSEESFDMNLVFQRANLGDVELQGSSQFSYPSFIRLGEEAKYLIYNAKNDLLSNERLSVCSSPKRYLWDARERKNEWEYILLNSEDNALQSPEPIWIDGISNQINNDGSISEVDTKGALSKYSRRSLMTFSFLEILSQAQIQINSHAFRTQMGNASLPRMLGRIIITCPTAMSRVEQISLRKAVEEAYVLLERYNMRSIGASENYAQIAKKVQIIPSVKALQNTEERTQWTYDEATCSQFVFLCAEIAERYKNNCEEYFNLYGKVREDLPGYDKKSLTVGSLDIGAGTTDLMISAYEYSSNGQTSIKPIPLFWESFYIAGDDMLKAFVQQLVIEGPHALISYKLREMGVTGITQKIADFFGQNTNRMEFADRVLRKDFNMQVSVPIALKYIELAQKQAKNSSFAWEDIFTNIKPNNRLLEAFRKHFGFAIEEVIWKYDEKIVNDIIVGQFDDLLKKIAGAMSAYQCDVVVLSGRPTTLKQIENLFLKYYPVSPNRLKVLNDYRVGRWYPFQNGDGYFTNQKSIVAVGALLGYVASTQGGFDGLSIDLSELQKRLLPTTEYFGVLNSLSNHMKDACITPQNNSAEIVVNDLPIKLGTRQIDTSSYPARSFYRLDFDDDNIAQYIINKNGDLEESVLADKINHYKEAIRQRTPLKVHILREDYMSDKEELTLDSIEDKEGEEISIKHFRLQVQSLMEDEDFWLDSGAFNLSITTL